MRVFGLRLRAGMRAGVAVVFWSAQSSLIGRWGGYPSRVVGSRVGRKVRGSRAGSELITGVMIFLRLVICSWPEKGNPEVLLNVLRACIFCNACRYFHVR